MIGKGPFSSYSATRAERRFLQNLIAYREARLHQYGESPYLLEPNVKDGVGGLRDLHTIRWAGIVYLQDPSLEAMLKNEWLMETEKLWLEQSYDFLWRVRLQLHQSTWKKAGPAAFPGAGTDCRANGLHGRYGRFCR